MERRQPYLKVAAVVSAVLLVGCFVAYRAGAFHRPAEPAPQPEQQSEGATQPAPNAAPPSRAIMYSSKSAEVFIPGSEVTPEGAPPAVPATPATPPAPQPVFLGGSKSDASFVPPRPGFVPKPPQP